MKRYLLFSCGSWEAQGGWCDFRNDFNTIEEAEKFLKSLKPYYQEEWHIVDLEIGQIVAPVEYAKERRPDLEDMLAKPKDEADIKAEAEIKEIMSDEEAWKNSRERAQKEAEKYFGEYNNDKSKPD